MNKERLEEIKSNAIEDKEHYKYLDGAKGYWVTTFTLSEKDYKWLIEQAEQVESMAHVIKVKNKEMRELSDFLKKRNIPLKKLSPLITVMAHVEFLEKALETNAKIAEYATEEKEELKQQNKQYREAMILARACIEYGRTDKEEKIYSILGEALEGEE